ncbi:hypothetical protein QBC42DRAFT_285964 [Cladorrhinum samala]|uniref:Uncharacterized protein n=1 Tax=Cladorrhinum samala TaxID=585594 RepID=A0AAV9HQ44_9PEZI|nr:hypothetical protein QBC42DRAFT_285964 [Cladorrhinum samala]
MESVCGLPTCGHTKTECLYWMIIQRGNRFLRFEGEESQPQSRCYDMWRFAIMLPGLRAPLKCGVVLASAVEIMKLAETDFVFRDPHQDDGGAGIVCLKERCSETADAFNAAMDRLRRNLARDTLWSGSLHRFGDQERFALHPTRGDLPGYGVPRDLAGILGITTHQVYANLWVNDRGEIKTWVMETDPSGDRHLQRFSGYELATDGSPLRALQRVIREQGHLQDVEGAVNPAGHIAFTTFRDDPTGSVDHGRSEFGKAFVFDINYLYSGFKFYEGTKYVLMSASEARRALFDLRFDPTSSLVMVDFLMRHDLLGDVPRDAIPRWKHRLRFN